MTPKDFIISSILDTTYIFEQVQCRYKYDELLETHYVEILPSSIFKDSKELKNYRGQILDKFYENFPTESLVFLTEGSLIEFGKEEVKAVGSKFSTVPTINPFFDKCFEPLLVEYKKLAIDKLMGAYEPILAHHSFIDRVTKSTLPVITRFQLPRFHSLVIRNTNDDIFNPIDTLTDNKSKTIYETATENKYALAA